MRLNGWWSLDILAVLLVVAVTTPTVSGGDICKEQQPCLSFMTCINTDDGYRCAIKVDGGWSNWTNWENCPVSCGGGNQSRTRNCSNPTPLDGGDDCVGEDTQWQTCGDQNCPVDGAWSDWSQWTECSDVCGGNQTRTRTCSNPKPAEGGRECIGETKDWKICGDLNCTEAEKSTNSKAAVFGANTTSITVALGTALLLMTRWTFVDTVSASI